MQCRKCGQDTNTESVICESCDQKRAKDAGIGGFGFMSIIAGIATFVFLFVFFFNANKLDWAVIASGIYGVLSLLILFVGTSRMDKLTGKHEEEIKLLNAHLQQAEKELSEIKERLNVQ